MLLEDWGKQFAPMTMMQNSVLNSFNGASVLGQTTEGEEGSFVVRRKSLVLSGDCQAYARTLEAIDCS